MFFNGCLVVSRKISYHTENKKSERRRPIFLFYQQLWNCLRTGHAHLMQIWNVGATCFKWFQYILYWVLVKPGREKTTNIPTMSFDILSPVELEIDYHGWRNKPTKKQQKKLFAGHQLQMVVIWNTYHEKLCLIFLQWEISLRTNLVLLHHQ